LKEEVLPSRSARHWTLANDHDAAGDRHGQCNAPGAGRRRQMIAATPIEMAGGQQRGT
jgi:hypothetical protein